MLRYLLFVIAVTILCSCARPPHLELVAAEDIVSKAKAMQAQEFAPSEYQAAETALDDARNAMLTKNYSTARDSLEFSQQHAQRAITLTEERQVKLAAEKADKAFDEEKKKQKALMLALQQQEAKKNASPPVASKPTAKSEQPKPVLKYTVGEGETLWTISVKPEVYNEGLLWPLLYKANRDQIKDPRQIFPGQTLDIRRDMTKTEIEEARQRARESDIFPVAKPTAAQQ